MNLDISDDLLSKVPTDSAAEVQEEAEEDEENDEGLDADNKDCICKQTVGAESNYLMSPLRWHSSDLLLDYDLTEALFWRQPALTSELETYSRSEDTWIPASVKDSHTGDEKSAWSCYCPHWVIAPESKEHLFVTEESEATMGAARKTFKLFIKFDYTTPIVLYINGWISRPVRSLIIDSECGHYLTLSAKTLLTLNSTKIYQYNRQHCYNNDLGLWWPTFRKTGIKETRRCIQPIQFWHFLKHMLREGEFDELQSQCKHLGSICNNSTLSLPLAMTLIEIPVHLYEFDLSKLPRVTQTDDRRQSF